MFVLMTSKAKILQSGSILIDGSENSYFAYSA